mgnify:FL=1
MLVLFYNRTHLIRQGAFGVATTKVRTYNYLISCGHLCSDINQGALAAVLPFLIAAYHYDYATAATLVLFSNLVGSVVQPIFGQLADRQNRPWLIPLGLLLAGGGIALTGVVTTFPALCAAVAVSGTGAAMFHPQAARLVHHASAEGERAKNISIFSFGGNLGFALGPVVMTAAVTAFGLMGTLVFLIPEVIICIAFRCHLHGLYALNAAPQATEAKARPQGIDQWGSFLRLTAIVFGRSIIFFGINTFLALYWIQELGQTEAMGSAVLSVYYAIGAACTLLGGRLADRYGYHRMIRIGAVILPPCIFLFTQVHSLVLAALLLLPIAASLSLIYSPMVVLGQQYLPNRVGLASGVTLGLAVSVGGVFTPVLGHIADGRGLTAALLTVAAIALIPAVFAFLLPPVRRRTL